MIGAFRGDDLPRRHSRNLGVNPNTFKNHGPRLKNCRGDEGVGIHVFAFSFDFKNHGPRLKDCRGDE